MPKKSKKCRSSTVPKWIETPDGKFSLVIESKKAIAAQKSYHSEVNNNEIKNLLTKQRQPNEKKSKQDNVSQHNSDSTYAVERLPIKGICSNHSNGISSSQLLPTSKLTDDISKFQINGAHSDTNSEKSFISEKSKNGIHIESPTKNGIPNDSMSETSEDKSFFDSLFTDSKPKSQFITAPTDTFPCEENSDNESEVVIYHSVKFYIDDGTWAEYNGMKYRIDHLDLTAVELSYLKIITETPIELEFDRKNIFIRQNRLCIKRIEEAYQEKALTSNNASLWFSLLNLVLIQFSTTEPILAKYQDQIYFVGDKLYEEYNVLLTRAKKNTGTAIRISRDRININLQSRVLDVFATIPLEEQGEVCVISGQNEPNTNSLAHSEFRRYIIKSDPYEVFEVELTLLHSSIHDGCTEIYAGTDFPFNEDEKVLQGSITSDEGEDDYECKSDLELRMVNLKPYLVPKDIKDIAAKKNKHTLRWNCREYIRGYKTMIALEEEDQARTMEYFNQTDIQITYYMERQFYFHAANQELAAAVEENILDRFVLRPKLNRTKEEIWGQVVRVKDQKVYIDIFAEKFQRLLNSHISERYDIIFRMNRVPYQLQHYALEFIEQHNLFTRLIDNSFYRCKTEQLKLSHCIPNTRKPTLEYEGTMLNELNTEQQSAVYNILNKRDHIPYVLFGPPGTGKTKTLVAAIEQIVRTTDQNVLVCASSNAACDEIAVRLLKVLREKEVYRFYAKSYKNEKISWSVMQNSNYSRDRIFYPSLKILYSFRVFVCTLFSAGCLTRARIDSKVWRPDHFSYVFIDECASAHEPTSLIPIAGLCTSKKEIHARIVLAGDPKQLDAVTRSDIAKKMGYNTSWLEQLCKTNLFSRNPKTGKFNETYITQLVKNYRSHPHILSVPNELFYENKLEPNAAENQINWYINRESRFLPSKHFPMLFKSVQGTCARSIEHSWFNDREIDEVVNVIKDLLPRAKQLGLKSINQSDIGVVTPYRKQRYLISQKLRRLNFDEVTVGTAEVFQGKEKPVIIISTVRSNGQLGFVGEPRRLNVCITRAKCLLVIIGDPHTLKIDENWSRILEFCLKNNSFHQSENLFLMSDIRAA